MALGGGGKMRGGGGGGGGCSKLSEQIMDSQLAD